MSPVFPGHNMFLFPQSRLILKYFEVFGFYYLPFFKMILRI